MLNCVLCHADFQLSLNFEFIVNLKKYYLPVACPRCLQAYTLLLKKAHCPQCGRSQKNFNLCGDCKIWKKLYGDDVVINTALFEYDGVMRDYFHDFKKQGNYRLRLVFKDIISDHLKKQKADANIFVPTAKSHLVERKFDPIMALYGDLIKSTVILDNYQGIEHQSLKTRHDRINSPQPFYLSDENSLKLKKASSILILDDIYTTGATIYHMREAIRIQGIRSKIISLTLAR